MFVKGKSYGEYAWLQDEEIKEAAVGLARWHKLLGNFDARDIEIKTLPANKVALMDFAEIFQQQSNWKRLKLNITYSKFLETIGRSQKVLAENMKSKKYAKLPNCIINGDYQKANVTYDNKGSFAGVFDPEFVRSGEKRIWDITRSLISYSGNFETPERLFGRESLIFLTAFNEIQPLYSEEIDLIPDVYRSILIFIIFHDLKNFASQGKTSAKLRNKINLYMHALFMIDRLNWDKWAEENKKALHTESYFASQKIDLFKIGDKIDPFELRKAYFEAIEKDSRLFLDIEEDPKQYEILDLLGEGRQHRGVVFKVKEINTDGNERILCLKVSEETLVDDIRRKDYVSDYVENDPIVLQKLPNIHGNLNNLKNTLLMDIGSWSYR